VDPAAPSQDLRQWALGQLRGGLWGCDTSGSCRWCWCPLPWFYGGVATAVAKARASMRARLWLRQGPVRLFGRGGEAAPAPLPPDPAIPRLQLLPSMRIRPERGGWPRRRRRRQQWVSAPMLFCRFCCLWAGGGAHGGEARVSTCQEPATAAGWGVGRAAVFRKQRSQVRLRVARPEGVTADAAVRLLRAAGASWPL